MNSIAHHPFSFPPSLSHTPFPSLIFLVEEADVYLRNLLRKRAMQAFPDPLLGKCIETWIHA